MNGRGRAAHPNEFAPLTRAVRHIRERRTREDPADDELAARAQNGQVLHTPGNVNPHPLSPPGSGTVYPAGAAPGGYGLVEEGGDDLGRPYAPFMGDAPDRSQTPPTPSSASQLYRGSAAAAAAGKGEYGQ